MHILATDDCQNETDYDKEDETIDMDSSGSHCLKLESFIARRRARENAGSQNSITVIEDVDNDVSGGKTFDARRNS